MEGIASNVSFDHIVEKAALARGITGLVCFVLCTITLVFEIVFICRLRKTKTLQRLYVYLTVSTLFYMSTHSLQIERYFHHQNNYTNQSDPFCTVIGVLDQYTGSVQLVFTLGITFVLFHKLFSLCGPYEKLASKFKPNNHHKRAHCGYRLELSLCIISIILPLLIIWVPFQNPKGGYGSTGPWCWIQSKDPTTGEEIVRGALEQILLWYAPFGLIALVSLFCIICVVSFFCYLRFHRGLLVERTQAIIKEMILLMAFLGIFCLISIIESVASIILNTPQVDISFALWMVYAIITPIGGVTVPAGFFVYFLCSKHYALNSSSSNVSVHAYSNIQTGKVGDRLIHNPSRISQPSLTRDRDSHFFLSYESEETSINNAYTQPLLTSASTRSAYLSVVEKT